MKFLEIKSKGLIEVEALTLIGASTKRGDGSKIGMFGSGLKYGIAAIIRQELPFIVFSGKKEIKITTEQVSFGGKKFNRIHIDNTPTSLTDSMGTEDWTGAFPYIREIYSNALDEDENATINLVDDINPTEDDTIFYIQANDEIINLMNNFSKFFVSDENVVYNGDSFKILSETESAVVFRHGIRAYNDSNIKSVFSYDLNDVDINESRVVRNEYQMYRLIGTALESTKDKLVLRKWINGVSDSNHGLLEHSCVLESWMTTVKNPELVDVILEKKYYPVEARDMFEKDDLKGRIALQTSLIRRFLKYAPDLDCLGVSNESDTLGNKMKFEAKPSVDLFDKVTEAVELLNKTRYKNRLTSPIKYYKFNDNSVLGQGIDNVIALSVRLDTYSVDEIAQIIIEEQEHILTSLNDETRAFQNHLFRLYYNELKRK